MHFSCKVSICPSFELLDLFGGLSSRAFEACDSAFELGNAVSAFGVRQLKVVEGQGVVGPCSV
jgi:hypothetical protein